MLHVPILQTKKQVPGRWNDWPRVVMLGSDRLVLNPGQPQADARTERLTVAHTPRLLVTPLGLHMAGNEADEAGSPVRGFAPAAGAILES